jgi:hypothetical protein
MKKLTYLRNPINPSHSGGQCWDSKRLDGCYAPTNMSLWLFTSLLHRYRNNQWARYPPLVWIGTLTSSTNGGMSPDHRLFRHASGYLTRQYGSYVPASDQQQPHCGNSIGMDYDIDDPSRGNGLAGFEPYKMPVLVLRGRYLVYLECPDR